MILLFVFRCLSFCKCLHKIVCLGWVFVAFLFSALCLLSPVPVHESKILNFIFRFRFPRIRVCLLCHKWRYLLQKSSFSCENKINVALDNYPLCIFASLRWNIRLYVDLTSQKLSFVLPYNQRFRKFECIVYL